MGRSSDAPAGASLRIAQRDSTRRSIVRAAGSCFRRQGFGATTVEDIARAAGTTRTTFYMYFKGKADVVAALSESVRRDTHLLLDELETAVASGRGDDFRAWLSRLFDFWERAGTAMRAEEEAASFHPEVQARRWSSFQNGMDAIARGLEAGGISDDAGRRARGLLAYSQLETIFHRWMRVGWDVDRDQVLEVMTDMWLAAFR